MSTPPATPLPATPVADGPRILIVKTSSMGDVVHALPAVSDLARALPGARIDWLVEPGFAALPGLHPAVQRVIPIAWRKWRRSLGQPETRQALRECWHALRQHRYTRVIDLQGLVKSALFAACAHGPVAGYGWGSIREPLAALGYGRRLRVPRDLHAVERCRRLAAAALGLPAPVGPPDFGLSYLAGFGPSHPAGLPARYAVLIPCASRPEKLWPEANWVALVRRLAQAGLPSVLMWGSPAEQARAQAIAAAAASIASSASSATTPSATPAAPDTPDARGVALPSPAWVPPFLLVRDAVPVLAGAELVVGLDTGLTHIAAACGRPTLGIYCDHDPGLAGVCGSGPVLSLGGKGQVPALAAVLQAVEAWLPR